MAVERYIRYYSLSARYDREQRAKSDSAAAVALAYGRLWVEAHFPVLFGFADALLLPVYMVYTLNKERGIYFTQLIVWFPPPPFPSLIFTPLPDGLMTRDL